MATRVLGRGRRAKVVALVVPVVAVGIAMGGWAGRAILSTPPGGAVASGDVPGAVIALEPFSGTASAGPSQTPVAPASAAPWGIDPGTQPVTGQGSTAQPDGNPPPDTNTPPSSHQPFPVTGHTYSDNNGGTGYDRRVAFSLVAPNDNGMAISRYEFDRDGNSAVDASSVSTSGFVTGLNNGATYQIRVRACNDSCGNWSSPGNAVTPYGPVPTPGAGAQQQGTQQIQLSWSGGGGNGRPLSRLEIRVNGGGWENVGLAAGGRVVGNGYNQTHSIQVRAFDSAGQPSPTASASATTYVPSPKITVSRGGSAVGQPGCTSSACAYIRADLSDFSPNTSYTCSINTPQGSLPSFTISTDGSGKGGRQSLSYYGYPNGSVTVTCGGASGTRNPWG